MFIRQILHTYKKNFPPIKLSLNRKGKKCFHPSDEILIWNLSTDLILELSQFSTLPKYCYITRHDNDIIPNENLKEHLKCWERNLEEVIDTTGKHYLLGISTVWFVAYSESTELIELIKEKIVQKDIKIFMDNPEVYNSIEEIPPDNQYTKTKDEAKMFPEFLHQITQIGIDLLRIPNSINELRQFKSLEWCPGSNIEINNLKSFLVKKSKYYEDVIEINNTVRNQFWANFQIIRYGYSWPHFLFNICGI